MRAKDAAGTRAAARGRNRARAAAAPSFSGLLTHQTPVQRRPRLCLHDPVCRTKHVISVQCHRRFFCHIVLVHRTWLKPLTRTPVLSDGPPPRYDHTHRPHFTRTWLVAATRSRLPAHARPYDRATARRDAMRGGCIACM